MPYPEITIEAAFTVGTSAAFILDDVVKGVLDSAVLSDEVWTDITAYALNFNTRRGATRAEGPVLRFEAGHMTVNLDNSDRRFDPTNTAGPYVAAGISQVQPMRQVRVLATYAGSAYSLFTGYADSWDIAFEEPAMSVCTLTATDATKVLADVSREAVALTGAGELAGARIHRILDSALWPVGQRQIAAGKSTMQATTLEGEVLAELVKVQDSEVGQVYIDGRGYVVFRDRHANMVEARSTTVQAAFGDGAGELPFVEHTIEYDDTSLANLVRIANTGGTTQTVSDATSIQQYLTHTHERTDLILETDAAAADYASFILYQAKDPELRFTQLTVNARDDDDALFPEVLGGEVGDLITLTRRPPGGGPVTTRRCFIVGINHEVSGPNQWRTTWALQSATRWLFLTLDDASLGVLDSNALAF